MRCPMPQPFAGHIQIFGPKFTVRRVKYKSYIKLHGASSLCETIQIPLRAIACAGGYSRTARLVQPPPSQQNPATHECAQTRGSRCYEMVAFAPRKIPSICLIYLDYSQTPSCNTLLIHPFSIAARPMLKPGTPEQSVVCCEVSGKSFG